MHDRGGRRGVPTPEARPRVTSFAPQFLVDDLPRSIAYYEKLGFTFGEPWDGFYAIGRLDGLELHLKEAPKHDPRRGHLSRAADPGEEGSPAIEESQGATLAQGLPPG